jgi:hypothetical protein
LQAWPDALQAFAESSNAARRSSVTCKSRPDLTALTAPAVSPLRESSIGRALSHHFADRHAHALERFDLSGIVGDERS